MPSPDDTGTHGRDALVEELKAITVARAPARFRAFPDDAGMALLISALVQRSFTLLSTDTPFSPGL